MTKVFKQGLSIGLSLLLLVSACRKRDAAALPDNLVNFESTSQGMDAATNSITLKVKLVRATDRNIPVTINLTHQDLVYGTDYTTVPAAVANVLSLTIPSGNNEASFTITKQPGILFDGDEKLILDINSSGAPVTIGATKQLIVSFQELVATTASIVVNGGGPTYPNKVFLDLSANRQTAIPRTAWDLGFYGGADDFRVILNSSSAMMAKQISKNDLTAVNASDTVGFSTTVAFNQAAPSLAALPYIDYPTGDLTRTAISAVSATAADNKVYIINRGTGIGSPAPARGWKKVRILRNAGGGYTLQHADIASTTFTTVEVSKDEAYFFKYVSFETGAVSVEPMKTKWDLAWTYFSNIFPYMGGEVPYLYQDIIIQNRNVQVAKVLTSFKSYDAFVEADIAAQTFSSSQTTIGSDWRSGGGPSSAPAVYDNRYYIIKDGENNVYKLRFTALSQNNERGYPAYQIALLKRG